MNFLKLCQRVVKESGIADSGPSKVDGQIGDMARIVDWVQESWLEIQRMHQGRWRFLWTPDVATTLLIDSSVVSYPAGHREPLAYSERLNGQGITRIEFELMRTRYRSKSRGRPSLYAIRPDGNIEFNTLADQQYLFQFDAYKSPAEFAEGISVPLMEEDYHLIIVWSALMKYALYDEAPETAARADKSYQSLLAQLNLRYLPEMSFGGPLA